MGTIFFKWIRHWLGVYPIPRNRVISNLNEIDVPTACTTQCGPVFRPGDVDHRGITQKLAAFACLIYHEHVAWDSGKPIRTF